MHTKDENFNFFFYLFAFFYSSSAEPTEEQPPDTTTPQQQQQVVIQPAQPQGDLLGGNLLDLLDISTGPTPSGPAYNAPAAGGGGGGRISVVWYRIGKVWLWIWNGT